MAIDSLELKSWDIGWMAMDDFGNIAILCTGGDGPIPKSAMPESIDVKSPEELLLDVPPVSDYKLVVNYPRPDDFVEIAKRGVYAYDWRDSCRGAAQCSGLYELAARPVSPINIDQLPSGLQVLARATRLAGVNFADCQKLLVKS